MTLSTLIRKGGLRELANANPANPAKEETARGEPLAKLAPLALATSQNLKAESHEKAGGNQTEAEAPIPLSSGEERQVRAWLRHIGEVDTDLVEHVLACCRTDSEKRSYYIRRAQEVPAVVPEVESESADCMHCQHQRGRAGEFAGCVVRLDLPALFGEGHPLRQFPTDCGANCESFTPWPDQERRTCH